MSKGKKLVIGTLAAVAILAGSLGGYAVMADTGEDVPEANQESIGPPEAQFWARVAEILEVDQGELKDAVAQARQEMMNEAIETRLDRLVDEGVITDQEAEDYLAWWQERPDVPMGFGPGGGLRDHDGCSMARGGRACHRWSPSQ